MVRTWSRHLSSSYQLKILFCIPCFWMVNESAEVGVITMKLLFCQILSNYGWSVFVSENCWWVGCLSVTRELALDCEMVGVGYEGKKDALARVSLVHITRQQLFVINLWMFPCIFGWVCQSKIFHILWHSSGPKQSCPYVCYDLGVRDRDVNDNIWLAVLKEFCRFKCRSRITQIFLPESALKSLTGCSVIVPESIFELYITSFSPRWQMCCLRGDVVFGNSAGEQMG